MSKNLVKRIVIAMAGAGLAVFLATGYAAKAHDNQQYVQHDCRSRCVNGDCEIVRDDGKRFHVQVQAQYDSFNNQWVYPSPECPMN
ncbi:hypothetical protein RI103_36270 [Paraburkholderia sp. FT54]|jgi:hypothetical protein|uniref:hypothetical protein n=1 Tax=Paraburkholderia sp. FT54 TaxID=3074437 RepID=UPI0028774E0E|nr:hypothetical protein [Paraburkholderia sp. FT54]WNC94598.1 hypothetical protein RI103_36270 [Paraburkholderia sp. FT54]